MTATEFAERLTSYAGPRVILDFSGSTAALGLDGYRLLRLVPAEAALLAIQLDSFIRTGQLQESCPYLSVASWGGVVFLGTDPASETPSLALDPEAAKSLLGFLVEFAQRHLAPKVEV